MCYCKWKTFYRHDSGVHRQNSNSDKMEYCHSVPCPFLPSLFHKHVQVISTLAREFFGWPTTSGGYLTVRWGAWLWTCICTWSGFVSVNTIAGKRSSKHSSKERRDIKLHVFYTVMQDVSGPADSDILTGFELRLESKELLRHLVVPMYCCSIPESKNMRSLKLGAKFYLCSCCKIRNINICKLVSARPNAARQKDFLYRAVFDPQKKWNMLHTSGRNHESLQTHLIAEIMFQHCFVTEKEFYFLTCAEQNVQGSAKDTQRLQQSSCIYFIWKFFEKWSTAPCTFFLWSRTNLTSFRGDIGRNYCVHGETTYGM